MGFGVSRKYWLRNGSIVAMALAVGLVCSSAAQAETKTYQFNIPAESAAKALNDFARQGDIQILFPYEAAAAFSTSGLKGTLTRDEALARLLANTNFEIAAASDTTITLRVVAKNVAGVPDAAGSVEVIVTGSRIRNSHPTSPVHTVTRNDIDQSGFSQIGDVMRSLPENFSGGQNPGVFQASFANEANVNVSNASTVNLRGLGSDATLVLVNGHRLAGDSGFQGSDISGVPLAAVERIEVVTDGASALYGSDAVAGVANIILRKSYSEGEVSARLGGATQGGGFEQTYSALKGFSSAEGSILVNLEFSKQDAVTAGERDFAAGAAPASTFLQPQRRASLFVSASRDIGEHMTLSVDALVADRRTDSVAQISTAGTPYYGSSYTPSYSLAPSLDFSLSGDWKLHWTGVFAGSRNSVWSRSTDGDFDQHYKNDVQYTEFTADGTLAMLPTGKLRVAVGGGYRHEGFQYGLPDASHFGASRTVTYVYGEAFAPLVEASSDRPGLHELELSLSARSESYSDFGNTTNPRIGLRYVPLNDLTLRATWGKSFKAPTFWQKTVPSYVLVYDAPDLGYTDRSGTALMTYGGNPDLGPETSTSWTFGGDFKPAGSVKLTATYFDIDYRGRIVQPVSNFSAGLSDPLYAPFVQLAPTAAEQAALIASGGQFYDYSVSGYDPATTVAIIHDAYQNATSQTISGVDLGYSQSFKMAGGDAQIFANGTWLCLKQQTSAVAPNVVLSGTIFNVPTFKTRGGISWQGHNLSATGVVNYISDETDTGTSPHQEIASWTTVDANLSYRFTGREREGFSLTLSISNLFDRDPPRAFSSSTYYHGLNFDSTNASILGRFASLTLTKAW